MQRLHYFFAIKLPDEIKSEINEWIQTNKEKFPFKRWVHQEDFHITLAFLGNAEKTMLKQAIMNIREVLQNMPSFPLEINQIGTFGQKHAPRIFWIDVKEQPLLSELQKKVYNQCKEVGFELDKKPFRPHITIARKWDSEEPFNENTLGDFNQENDESLIFQVSEVVLYETHLDKTPKYKIVEKFEL